MDESEIAMKKILNLICVGVLVATTGCVATTGPKKVNVDAMTHSRAQLIISSDTLLKNVAINNIRFGSVGNFERVQMNMQNTSNNRLNLEYKIEWMDQQGFSVNDNSVWHRFTLSAHQIETIQSVGKVPEAYSVKVTVRFPGDVFIDSYNERQKEAQKD